MRYCAAPIGEVVVPGGEEAEAPWPLCLDEPAVEVGVGLGTHGRTVQRVRAGGVLVGDLVQLCEGSNHPHGSDDEA